jgi:hypothetical protein
VAKVCGVTKFCRSRINRRTWPYIKWVQEWYFAPLDRVVLDEPSPPAADRLEEIEPEEYYTEVGNDGRGLRVPADLDESICCYLDLLPGTRRNSIAPPSGSTWPRVSDHLRLCRFCSFRVRN